MLPILRYQGLWEAVPANTPAAAVAAPAPAARGQQPADESVDDIVGEILKQPASKGRTDDDDENSDAEPADAGDDSAADDAGDAGAGSDDAADDAADAADADGDSPDDAPSSEALKAARKALAEGDLDKAFQLAFGKKPEELQPDNKAWTAWRKANERKEAEIATQRQAVDQRHQQNQAWVQDQQSQLQRVIEQLRPYDVYYQLEQRFARDGDYSALVQLVEHASKMSYDDAQKLILTKSRRSPGERQLQQKLEEQERKLRELEQARTQETQQQEQARLYQQDLTTIRGQLKGEVTKVPDFDKRVYAVLLKTRAPTGGLTITVEEAGRRVLAAERRRLQQHPLLKQVVPAKDPKVSQAAATLAKSKKGKPGAPPPPLRRDSHGNGASDPNDESVDDILSDILKKPVRRAQ